ncbi:MAG: hypothetical protein PHX62_05755 [Bacilli bacterium]|nr:hypothetical protein [Bacilli bacterium]
MDDTTKDFDKNLPIEEAAKIMGKSKQFVRVGLQRGILPFGTAVKLSSRWTYYISPPKFYDYVGGEINRKDDGYGKYSAIQTPTSSP